MRQRSFREAAAQQPKTNSVTPATTAQLTKNVADSKSTLSYTFNPHWHPYATQLLSRLVVGGLESLLAADTDETNGKLTFYQDFFTQTYGPAVDPSQPASVFVTDANGDPYPAKSLDFESRDGYSTYNWELFFHVPFMIATQLSKNQNYAEAQQWFHYIFDPTAAGDEPDPSRYWKVQPFKVDPIQHAEDFLLDLHPPVPSSTTDTQLQQQAVDAINAWRDNPFSPFTIARTRPTAFMYKTVMAYLDNLIAWGDSLFQQNDRESINQALSIYVLAANILGPRPQPLPKVGTSASKSYGDLVADIDAFGDALEDIETDIPFDLVPDLGGAAGSQPTDAINSVGSSLYFCIPTNDELLSYWDTVGDRLYKIRNSLNFSGVFQQLPLFPPPIDPGLLAQAEAAGVDVGALVAGQEAPSSPVRFRQLLARAMELCQEVKNLGAQLLSAMEKQDAEALTLLRAQHETFLLTLGTAVSYGQWQEATKAREATEKSLARAWARYSYYEQLLGRDPNTLGPTTSALDDWTPLDDGLLDSGASAGTPLQTQEDTILNRAIPVDIDAKFSEGGRKLSPGEAEELAKLSDAQTAQEVAGTLDIVASSIALIPNAALKLMPFGLGGDVAFGGSNLGSMFTGLAMAARMVGSRIGYEGTRAGRMAGFARREEEWKMQSNIAAGDLTEGYKQLRAAELREHIAKREYNNHNAQIEKSQEIEDFLTSSTLRNTPEDLYLWMKGEIKGLYNQCFALAYDVAKKAERGYHYELADGESATFIQTNYLSGQDGFLAGDKLYLDLARMQIAYTELNKREFELTKYVSLRDWFPAALAALRQSSTCRIVLNEQMFDLDCPGHAFRRIKAVALSIPSVTGPYVTTNCSLMLNQSQVRRAGPPSSYPSDPTKQDTDNFLYYSGSEEQIVTSSASSDHGLFETNLQDERYLPFEAAGAISDWSLSLLGVPAFDLSTISDVVMTVRYTARLGGDTTGVAKKAATDWQAANFALGLSMRSDFSANWAIFLSSTDASPTLSFDLTSDYYPYRARNIDAPPARLKVFASGNLTGNVTLTGGTTQIGDPQTASATDGSPSLVFDGSHANKSKATPLLQFGTYMLAFDKIDTIEDLWLVFEWG